MKLKVHGSGSTGEFIVGIVGSDAERTFSKGLTAYETAHAIALFLEETTETPAPPTEPEPVPEVPAKKSKAPPKDAA